MSSRSLVVVYLIVALITLRIAGVHVHMHNHAPIDSHESTHLVQLASGDDHGDQHSHDVDVDVLDASFVKKLDLDGDQPLLLAALVLVLFMLPGASHLLRAASATPYFPELRYRLPPATAPPF